ncbi:hypothetical protein MPSEU_000280800 [Mayamaea pseudoterrestris]|nr:hypothetical protein MPSEU_000280800 [Mayamaea pseudoterrestris]
MSSAVSRPVHPCVLSLTDALRGAESSCWAYLERRKQQQTIPNLVTAASSCVTVYRVNVNGKLSIVFNGPFTNLAGSVSYLATLSSNSPLISDALLIGFAGADPKLSVVSVQYDLLQAECLLDLGALQNVFETSGGATEHPDALCKTLKQKPGHATIACVIGGGLSVVVVELRQVKKTWVATKQEPYVVPLSTIATKLPHLQTHAYTQLHQMQPGGLSIGNTTLSSLSTGFGDIFDATFLSCYQEPVLLLLHSDPQGRVWSGRLGRTNGQGGVTHPYYVTALSVSVHHDRCALLWSTTVSADAISVHAFDNDSKCLVVGVNTLTVLDATGAVEQVTAVNGWAKATCPNSLMPRLRANPLLKLSIALDGSAWTWVDTGSAATSATALVSLRRGQLYIFQRLGHKTWSLLPTGQTLGGIGQIDHMTALSLNHASNKSSWVSKLGGEKSVDMSMGLIFAGSRLGNSLLLGFALEAIKMPSDLETLKHDLVPVVSSSMAKTTSQILDQTHVKSDVLASVVDEDYDRILRIEEEALYAPCDDNGTNVDNLDTVPDVASDAEKHAFARDLKRQRLATSSVVRVLTPLDSLVHSGPLGKSCEGPIASTPTFLIPEETPVGASEPISVIGSPALVFPAGHGSSGGLSILTAPGRDDRMILGEQDCMNVDCIFSLPVNGLLLLGMSEKAGGGTRVLRSDSGDSECPLNEIDIREWNDFSSGGQIFESTADVFLSTLHMAGEFLDGSVCVLVSTPSANGMPAYFIVVLEATRASLVLKIEIMLETSGDTMNQATPFVKHQVEGVDGLAFACVWSSGRGEAFIVSDGGILSSCAIEASPADDMDIDDDDIQSFYKNKLVVSVDVFTCPKSFFAPQLAANDEDAMTSENGNANVNVIPSYFSDDDEEAELYGIAARSTTCIPETHENVQQEATSLLDEVMLFVAVCRQSGHLEVYSYGSDGHLSKCWTAAGCGQGVEMLQNDASSVRLPRSHLIAVKEMRFFLCKESSNTSNAVIQNSMCLAIETTAGDLELYSVKVSAESGSSSVFYKVRSASIVRSSQEQHRHFTKLVRRRIVEKTNLDDSFSFVRLHRFSNISGLDGLFASCSQSVWIVPERENPKIIVHRTRHGAPAGGKPRPVSGFCSGLLPSEGAYFGFVTLHERVGRVGSQRITAFHGLSPAFQSQGLLVGNSSYLAEKILLGVTVRAVCFIDDDTISSPDRPIYAMLVSRELEVDQLDIDNDGVSPEEKERIQEEKQAAKIQKQVEADLGGFDLETEWVEEIEREDCFAISDTLGGAPPLVTEAYSLWIVDAASNWMVVDSFEFEEYEHALTMKVMRLTDFPDVSGSSEEDTTEHNDQLFVTVGTGIVNHNGEDVTSKGRALLFEISPPAEENLMATDVPVLSLKYEKNISHGPVTSLSCLAAEGRHRLVIGAGADVNVEQWGSNRLTQVGFFRATMHILDIHHFKNFLLLSDAYDSLHFLIWRESDKSLTLLAKDYDPIAVYAAGLMSRGAAMTFICNDDRQNLQFFQYSPGEAAARGGNKLVCRADFHVGSQTTAFESYFCRSSLHVHSATPSSTLAALKQQDTLFGKSDDDQKVGAFFGTTDGSIHGIVPLSEPVYWRLMALQSVMANALESDCGLNQRAYRLYRRSPRRGGCRSNDRKKGVIDGDFVMRYVDLSLVDQEDLASAIGSTVDLVVDNLLEIQCNRMLM